MKRTIGHRTRVVAGRSASREIRQMIEIGRSSKSPSENRRPRNQIRDEDADAEDGGFGLRDAVAAESFREREGDDDRDAERNHERDAERMHRAAMVGEFPLRAQRPQ